MMLSASSLVDSSCSLGPIRRDLERFADIVEKVLAPKIVVSLDVSLASAADVAVTAVVRYVISSRSIAAWFKASSYIVSRRGFPVRPVHEVLFLQHAQMSTSSWPIPRKSWCCCVPVASKLSRRCIALRVNSSADRTAIFRVYCPCAYRVTGLDVMDGCVCVIVCCHDVV